MIFFSELKRNNAKKTQVTLKDFYCHRIQVRNEQLIPTKAGRLFHQYLVDAFSRVSDNNLNYIRQNQSLFRAETYAGVH